MRPVAILLAASLSFGALVLIPARYLVDDALALQGLTAFALCLLPAILSLAWACLSARAGPEQKLVVFLGGTGLRLAAVFGGGIFLTQNFPDFFTRAFWLWVFLFYTFTLSLEIALLLGRRGPLASPDPATGPPREVDKL